MQQVAVKYAAMHRTDCESCIPGSSVAKTLVSFWEMEGANVTFGKREKCFAEEEAIIWGDWGIVELWANTQSGKILLHEVSPGLQESHVYLKHGYGMLRLQETCVLKSQLHNLNVSTSYIREAI